MNILALDTKKEKMSLKDKEARNEYLREYKKRKRRERGLQKQGRKTVTDPLLLEQRKENRKEWEKEWSKEYFRNHPVKRLLWTARSRAKRKGLDCSIEESDIVIPTHCPYLGIELVLRATKKTPRTAVASLDRIDTKLGYVKGNVEVISWLANTMKNNATPEQLLSFAKAVMERHEYPVVGR
jgi:hypothetical protein